MIERSTQLEYVPYDPPKDLGYERWGMHGEGRRLLCGYYRVTYGDGFNVVMPHSAHKGTIGRTPLDVEDPQIYEMLIDSADRTRMATA